MNLSKAFLALLLAMVLAFCFSTVAVFAQDDEAEPDIFVTAEQADFAAADVERGKHVWEEVGVCLQCHGWDGNGLGKNPRSPGRAALLRDSTLDPVTLYSVIACGLPGTAMPYHDRLAYRDARCFGMVLDDFEDGEKPHRGKTMRDSDIVNLVAYMNEFMLGAGETTLAQCEEFFGRADHPSCRGLD